MNPLKSDLKMSDRLKGQFFITVRDRDGKIVSRGKSKPHNLLMHNFGNLLSSMFILADANQSVTLTDILNASVTAFAWTDDPETSSTASMFFRNATLGMQIGVGDDDTAPDRADYDLGNILESWTDALTVDPTYDDVAFQVVVSGSITLAAGGTIKEAGVAIKILNSTLTAKTIMLAHGLISPNVGVPVGGTVAVNWILQI